MQRRNNASGGGSANSVPLHHPAPQHVFNPRNLHSSPPPGAQSLASGSTSTGVASAGGASGGGAPADYQRFSSPPVTTYKAQSGPSGPSSNGGSDYQRFSSPPVNAQQQQQHSLQQPLGNMYSAAATTTPGQQPGQHHAGFQQQQQGFGSAGSSSSQHPNGAHQPWNQFGVMNDATAQMGMQFGRSAVQAGQDYMNRNVFRHLPVTHLLHSFNVSNSYVINKLRLVLFPWRHRPWSRMVKRNDSTGQIEGYKPPRDDINSPDLYIPVMALVTYILLAGVVSGTRGDFHPDNLGMTASRSLGIVFIEFCFIRLGTYLLSIGGEGTVVDLFSYSGYKFVGIIVTLVFQLFNLTGWVYWSVFVYVFCANAFFLLRSLRYVVRPDPDMHNTFDTNNTTVNTSTISHAQRGRRIKFLFAIAVSQIGSMWYLVRV